MSKAGGLFKIVSILAILHLLGLAGLMGLLWSKGTLSTDRVQLIAGVLRGEYDPPSEDESGPAVSQDAETESPQAALTQEQLEVEMTRRQLERQKTELEQRLELVLREMARVQREREYFEERRQREAEVVRKKGEQNYRRGFEKQLDLFGKMKPQVAVEYLLSRDVEEATELLRALDTRKGKKIIEAARTPNQRKKMDEILKLLPELNVEP